MQADEKDVLKVGLEIYGKQNLDFVNCEEEYIMKKRKLCLLLYIILTISMLAGCKNQTDKEQNADGMTKAEAEKVDNKSERTSSGHETKDSETEAKEEDTTDVSDNTQASQEQTKKTDTPVNTQETKEQTQIPVETAENIITEPPISKYSYADMSNVMYAISAVNVRNLPSVDGERIGTLNGGQEILVTGQCNETGWYRVNFNDRTGYVSNNYLGTEKPIEKSTEIPTTEKPAAQAPEIPNQTGPSGLIAPANLANISSLKKRCTNEEFQAAYNVAVEIVTPLIGLSREEQLIGIAEAIRNLFDSGRVQYSVEAPHYDDPYGYFVTGVGSCAGCARATGLCLNMLNIPYEHVNENQWSHQWCRVNVNGVYWICDAYGLYVGPEWEPYKHPYLD